MYEVKKLVKKFDEVTVLKQIDLDIKEGEKIVIMVLQEAVRVHYLDV